ncbi:MAG: hypothetical protein JWL59_4298 [Chthoniobacteraceae bacterium]|nr:hypothetical protein [Chthoniobacteraceae bacterium]
MPVTGRNTFRLSNIRFAGELRPKAGMLLRIGIAMINAANERISGVSGKRKFFHE